MGTGDGQFDPENGRLGNGLVAVKPDETGELKLAGYYGPSNADWLWKRDMDINVSPMSFDYKGRRFVAGTSKECRVWLLDRDEFGGEDHRTPLYRTPLICNDMAHFAGLGVWGAMAFWEDEQGNAGIAVPFYGPVSRQFHAPLERGRPERGGVATFRLERRRQVAIGACVAFERYRAGRRGDRSQWRALHLRQWRRRASYPEDRAWDEPPPTTGSTGLRIADSTHATLYAMNAATGEELWTSGNQIASWNHFSGISAANGRVYIPTFDGYLYCFGIAK
jgi:hypothetical protein